MWTIIGPFVSTVPDQFCLRFMCGTYIYNLCNSVPSSDFFYSLSSNLYYSRLQVFAMWLQNYGIALRLTLLSQVCNLCWMYPVERAHDYQH